MIYTVQRTQIIAEQLRKFSDSNSWMVVGQFANLEFWINEGYVFLNELDIQKGQFPTWSNIELNQWEIILKEVIYKTSNSFSFEGISCKHDLFPIGLAYFNNWDIREIDLVEYNDQVICRFELNEDCKRKFLNFDYVTHSKNFETPVNWNEYTVNKYWYEFDILYFFKDEEITSIYVNHEQEIQFLSSEYLEQLNPGIKQHIVEQQLFNDHMNKLLKKKSSG